jgi:chromosome segregation ATPase
MEPHYERENPNARPPSTEDMLERLCRTQAVTIQALRADLDESIRSANCDLAEMRAASEERRAELERIRGVVATLRQTTASVVHQRDTVLTALRRLLTAIEQYTRSRGAPEAGHVMQKICREAIELVTVIDQLQAAAGTRSGE